jgi:hypothetical protein
MLLIALIALSWSGVLEQTAERRLSSTLERALLTAAIARGLNGAISVAQGTEIAIQPIGVGITIAAGEILDPLNDLVERFSWLALVASASLGTQLLLTEIFAEPFISYAVSAVIGVYLVFLWWPGTLLARLPLMRMVALIVMVRFLFTIVSLSVGWVDAWVLEARQQTAMVELTSAREEIEALNSEPPDVEATESSVRQRFESLLDGGRQLLDLEAQLSQLQERVETSISQMLELTALFLIQTLLVPLLAFWLSLAAFRGFWAWIRG